MTIHGNTSVSRINNSDVLLQILDHAANLDFRQGREAELCVFQ